MLFIHQLNFSGLHIDFHFLAFQIIHYRLVIEGAPNLVDHLGLLDNGPFSCRSIFQRISPAREINLTVYIYFHWAEVTCKNLPFYPSIDWKDDLKKLEGGTFHLLYVTHKFPVPYKVYISTVFSILLLSCS